MYTANQQAPLDLSAEIKPLIHKLRSEVLDQGESAVITFIAARSGEGTSTVARSFAKAFGIEMGKRILLIDADPDETVVAGKGIVERAVAGENATAGLSSMGDNVSCGRWITSGQGKVMSGRLMRDGAFWAGLRGHFDLIVIDAPALQSSSDGIAFAQASNMAILVVEAESTRKEVVENLRDTLAAANVKIAGIVMNKRKFYIPEKRYKKL